MTLINVTVSGNAAAVGGGGITNNATLVIRSSTISDNATSDGQGSGGVLTFFDAANSVHLSNSIIAGNRGSAPDCSGPIVSDGYNLIGDNAGCGGLTPSEGDRLGVDPGLAPLADNGGGTLTHALLPGSVAVDAGNPAPVGNGESACPPVDQRGAGRPQGAGCDVGAFETTPDCGNATLDPGESCDDGNATAGDCCSPLCAAEPLAGDCNADGTVGIDELLRAVAIALGTPTGVCAAADPDGDGTVAIAELIGAVRAALVGCVPSV